MSEPVTPTPGERAGPPRHVEECVDPWAGKTVLGRVGPFLAVVIGAIAIALTVGSAGADTPCDGTAFPWQDEAEMVTYSCPARDYVFDPGVDDYLTDQELTSSKAVNFYGDAGATGGPEFSQQWLWYANRTTMTTSSDSVQWAHCELDRRTEAGELCTVDNDGFSAFSPLQDAFDNDNDGIPNSAEPGAQPVQLSVLSYGGAFIATGCGNHSLNEPVDDPEPTLVGFKYHDRDRDGRRDTGEPGLGGFVFDLVRVSSRVGQPGGSTGYTATSATSGTVGEVRFTFTKGRNLGPGTYRLVERPVTGWTVTSPNTYMEFEVGFGAADREIRGKPGLREVGNARTQADVAKVSFAAGADFPAVIDVLTPTVLPIDVTIANLGPADRVRVEDLVTVEGPEDCTFESDRASRSFTLVRGAPPTSFTVEFLVTCSRPSEHEFVFRDTLSIVEAGVTDPNPANNTATFSMISEVHAFTDLGVEAGIECAEETDVGVPADCDVQIIVTNDGFGPVDATVQAELSMPDDCTSTPELATLELAGLADGAEVTSDQTFVVVCTHRSFHDFETTVSVTADDPHVFDTDADNNTSDAGPWTMEVFNDATMAAVDVHLTCDEQIGVSPFTCTATVDYQKTGPAPAVDVVLYATLSETGDCTAAPMLTQEQQFVLDGGAVQTRTFAWSMSCPESDSLHPFFVTTDIAPSSDEPHAVDDPGPITDWWVVPYCLPTVNPHGKKEPQAPGTGMNEDGFYIFGTLPGGEGEPVYIRDDESGVVFGPFDDGTRIKWVEANGATPTISPMGGNNGNGNGNAVAVDYQIRAQGDAEAFFVDEKGVEVSVTCLVPPFPK